MGDMADWHLEQMDMPCEWCGEIHLTKKQIEFCEAECRPAFCEEE